jgi:hypothetical protein
MFCVVKEEMGSNNFYEIWTKISLLEHSEVSLSFRKGSANPWDERYLFYFDIAQNNQLNLLKLLDVYIAHHFYDTNIAFDRIHNQMYMYD